MAGLENNQASSSRHGGARKGSGRKVGSATKKTREIADKAAADGLTPLEVMLETMRGLVEEAKRVAAHKPKEGEKQIVSPLELMMAASGVAKDAAPYIHPKLAAIEHSGANGGAIQTENKWLVELVQANGVPPNAS